MSTLTQPASSSVMPTEPGSCRSTLESRFEVLTVRFSSTQGSFFYDAWLTELMLKSGTRTGGIAARVK